VQANEPPPIHAHVLHPDGKATITLDGVVANTGVPRAALTTARAWVIAHAKIVENEKASRPHHVRHHPARHDRGGGLSDGRTVRVALTGLIESLSVFAPLETPEGFASAKAADFSWWLEWDCGATLDVDRVVELALEQAGMAANVDFRRWQDAHGLSLAQAATAIGLSRRTVSQYRTGMRPVPRTVALACKG
jgi:DNA-binding XRE family transcriptional regulator